MFMNDMLTPKDRIIIFSKITKDVLCWDKDKLPLILKALESAHLTEDDLETVRDIHSSKGYDFAEQFGTPFIDWEEVKEFGELVHVTHNGPFSYFSYTDPKVIRWFELRIKFLQGTLGRNEKSKAMQEEHEKAAADSLYYEDFE